MTVQFKCKDFMLLECEFEIRGASSADELVKLVDGHVAEVHRTLKVSPETKQKIRQSFKA